MKKFIIIFIIYLFTANCSNALEVVYPKKNNITTSSKTIFLIGNAQEALIINNEPVQTVNDGGFAYFVSLNEGENTFVLKSGDEILTYKIIRKNQTLYKNLNELKEFEKSSYTVVKDNATLRMTPIDAGINRLSQLPINTKLLIDAQKGGFYRVYLNENEYAWIAISDVSKDDCQQCLYAKIKRLKDRHDKEFIYYRFKLSERAPFEVINNGNDIFLRFFNTDEKVECSFMTKGGFEYYYDENNIFTLKVRYKIPKSITVTIDAGHGGTESGAVGCLGHKEKDINLNIAKYLKKELECEFNVVMTREEDCKLSLQRRTEIARENNSLIFVSVHANALPDSQNPNMHRGTSVYYYHSQSKNLAESILKEITEQTGTNNDKVRQGSLAIAREPSAISVLVEVGYMINPQDNMLLTDSDFQKRAAKAIADGIRNYLAN